MRVCELPIEQVIVGLRLRGLQTGKLGTIVSIDENDDRLALIRWDGDDNPTSGFHRNECECEVYLGYQAGIIEPRIRWSMPDHEVKDHLDLFWPVLRNEDQKQYKHLPPDQQYRWITSRKRIDWGKFFRLHTWVHDLALFASYEPRTNPVGFLRPDFVHMNVISYQPHCPPLMKQYAGTFLEYACERNFEEMKNTYELIQVLSI